MFSPRLLTEGEEFVTSGEIFILSPYLLLTLSPSANGENTPPKMDAKISIRMNFVK